ncbi:MAG: translation elongation factor Ts [Chloroflexota bacterium]|nr:translation elongation factor Ts [Chloroflexota bacterium]
MAITTAQIKELREKSGAGIMESKRALEETGGNIDKAIEVLRQQGVAKASKKADRVASQGLVEPYIHGGGRIGALVEVNCETDFVARTPDFQSLAHDIAMQVAATAPRYVSGEDIPEGDYAGLESEFGSREEAISQVALMDQVFIKNPKVTIREHVKAHIGKLGENILVSRFSRFELGGDSTSAAMTTQPTGTDEG